METFCVGFPQGISLEGVDACFVEVDGEPADLYTEFRVQMQRPALQGFADNRIEPQTFLLKNPQTLTLHIILSGRISLF